MKKLLLLMLMAVVMLPSVMRAQQQTLTVSDGTATNEYVPIYGYYADVDQHTQMVYPSTMFDNIQGAQISSITFYSSDAYSFVDFTVKIGEVTASSFTSPSFFTNSLNTVYTGTITIAGGEMTINFTTPYLYEGGNLLIDFSNIGDAYHSCYFTGTSATGGGILSYNGNTSVKDFLPKLTLTYTPGAPITCPRPTNITASNVDDQSATISWLAGGTESSWDIYVTTTATDIPDANTTPTYTSNDITYFLSGLNSSTHYYVYVRANCGAGDVSSWLSTNFMTSQVAAQLPYTCDFEDATENVNWTMQNNGPNGWYIGSAVNATSAGQNALYISNNNGTTNAYSHSTSTAWAYRDIDFDTYAEYNLSFKYKNRGESNYYDYLRVYIGTPATPVSSGSSSGSGCTPAGAQELGVYSLQETWQEAHISLNSTYSGVQRLYFLWWNDSGGGDNPPAAIDDITITATNCGAPVSITFDSTTTDSYTFHFVPALPTDNAWEAMIYSATDTVSEFIYDTAYTFTNLNPNTLYYVKVRTDCGGEPSAWRGPISARTQCAAVMAPTSESFANFNNDPSPCWSRYSVLASSVFSGAESLADHTTTAGWIYTSSYVFPLGHPKVNVYGTNPQYWLVSPEIDLSALATPTLTFSLALSDYGNANPIEDPTVLGDDKFMVIISTDGGATWSESNATIWNDTAASADYSYSTISTTGQDVSIDLSQYAGQIINVAFYAESTVSGGDNDLHIANFYVGEPITCSRPAEVFIDSITSSEVEFSWSPSGTETSWEYLCVPQGTVFDEDTATWETAYDTTAIITNLNSNTGYTVYVRAYCGPGELSQSKTADFRTACGNLSVPYTENFDGFASSVQIPCWTVMSGTVQTSTSYPCSGNLSLKFSGSSSMIALPELTTDLSQIELTFSTRPESFTSSSCGSFQVGYVTDITNVNSFVAIESYSYSDFSACEEKSIMFTNAPAGSHIAFKHIPTSSIWYWFVDDINIHNIPSCPKPASVSVTNTNTTSVTLSWVEAGTATAWNVAYGPAGFTMDANTTIEPVYNDNFVTISNLTSGTAYDFYVQSDCGGEYSLWKGPITATPGVFNMSVTGSDTLTTCEMTIYDNGGPNGNYSNDCSSYLYLYPENPDAFLSIEGSIVAESASFDYIIIYDGIGTANQIYKTDQTGSSQTLNFGPFNSTTGPLTIYFHSDASSNYEGFTLHTECLSCVAPAVTISDLGLEGATLTWSDNNGQNTAWQVAYGPAGFNLSTVTPEDVYTNSYIFTGLTSNTSYDFYIRTDCGDGSYSSWSPVLNFMTLAGLPAQTPYFCDFEDADENASWALVNATETNQWYIGMPGGETDSVLFISGNYGATESYENNISSVWAYRDITFGAGAEFNLSFKYKANGESSYDYMNVFIGAPAAVQGGSTTNPSGSVQLGGIINGSASWDRKNFVLDASYANTTQRLYFYWHNDVSVNNDPAAVLDSIQITVSDCGRPYGLEASNLTATSFDVTFSPAVPTDMAWEYVVCAAGANPDNETPTSLSDTAFTVTGLTANTLYNVYVRTSCDGGGYSAWSNTISVRTSCEAITTLPYQDNFDTYGTGTTIYPACWSKINTYSSDRPYISTTNYSAPGSMYFYAGTSGTYNIAITPQFDASIPVNTLQATFMYKGSNSSDKLIIGVISDPLDASTFTPVDTVYNSTVWDEYEVNFANYTGNGQYIAFKNVYNSTSSAYAYLDNLYIETIPTCPRPHNLVTTGSTSTSVTVSWLETGSAAQWEVEYGPAGFTQGNGTVETATTNPYTIASLNNTVYDIYVRSDCGGGDYSIWTGPLTVQPGSYNIPANGTDTITGCDITIYDNGGVNGNYSDNCSGYVVVYPETPGSVLSASGSILAESSSYDYIIIYDGVGTANQLYKSNQSSGSSVSFGPIVSTTGPLTIYFRSDVSNNYEGFHVDLSCVTCIPVSNLTATNISDVDATINWNSDATNFNVIYGPAGFDPEMAGTTVTATSTSYTLTGLSAETAYDVYVQTDCGNGDYSSMAMVNFTTQACSLADQCEYIFICSDDYGDGWNDGYLTVEQNGAVVASVEAINHDYEGETSVDTFSVFICSGVATTLTWHTGSYDDEVGISVIAPDGTSVISLYDLTAAASPLATFTPNCAGTPSSCDAPTNLAVSNITTTGATATWTAGGTESAWNLQYKAASAANWSSSINVTTPTYSFTGLTPNTAYQVRVQAACDAATTSDWTAAVSFTTAQESGDPCVAPSNLTVTDIHNNDVTLSWTENGTATSWTIYFRVHGTTSWTTQTVTTNPYTLTGLEGLTEYDFQIVSNCSATETSDPSNTVTGTTTNVGINDYVEANVTVAPNPTTGVVRVSSSKFQVSGVDVYDVYGKLLNTMSANDGMVEVDLGQYAAGVYFLRVSTESGMVTKRVVKR